MPEMKIRRKLFRMVGLLFPIVYLAGDAVREGTGRPAAIAILLLFLGIMLPLEWTRRRRPGVNRWLFARFSSYTKEKERARTSGTTWFLAGCLLTILIFDKPISIAAILLLVFVDAVAEFAGTRWGRHPLLGKSLEGTLAGLAAGLAVTLGLRALGMPIPPAAGVAGAVAASLCELLPLRVDDNLSVPLGAGTAMVLAQRLLAAAGG